MSESSPAHSAEMDTGYQNVAANGPKKRNRAAIACSSCRQRKMKCSHMIPEQTADEMLRGVPKSAQAYIRSLERRVRLFEDRQQNVPSVPEQTDLSSPPRNQTPRPARDARAALLSASRPPSSVPDSYRHVPEAIITESPEIFMGGKASESFTQLILNAMNHGSAKMETHSYSSPKEIIGDTRGRPDLLELPPDAGNLIKVYIGFHHIVTPIFHVPTILAQFERVLTCDPTHRHEHLYTIALLNMVCAIVVVHNRLKQGRPEIVGPIARNYYDTAMLLVRPTIFADWTIEKVQILILGSCYLQASSYPEECWNTLGLAVRMAYGLELHRPPDPTRFDCIAQEVRKRVWAACYVLDQLLSMIYGRPAATSAKSFFTTLPEDLDDDCIQPSRLLYPSIKSELTGMSFFLAISKLYRILESAASLSDHPSLENILRLDEEFEAWSANLPPSLKIRNGAIVENEISLILALRANMVRILIHRQSLVSVLNSLSGRSTPTLAASREEPDEKGGRLRLSMMQRSRQICVTTAEDVIQLVGQRHEQTKDAMGPSWFNLYYLFNAILIIFSHVVDPQYVEDRSALMRLDQAVHMIRQMSANHLCAQRAFIFLQQLLALLDKTIPEGRHRHARYRSASVDIVAQGDTRLEYPAAFVGDGVAPIPDYTMQADGLDLWSFLDYTQDLTTDLESQLNLHSTLGSAMWSWGG